MGIIPINGRSKAVYEFTQIKSPEFWAKYGHLSYAEIVSELASTRDSKIRNLIGGIVTIKVRECSNNHVLMRHCNPLEIATILDSMDLADLCEQMVSDMVIDDHLTYMAILDEFKLPKPEKVSYPGLFINRVIKLTGKDYSELFVNN